MTKNPEKHSRFSQRQTELIKREVSHRYAAGLHVEASKNAILWNYRHNVVNVKVLKRSHTAAKLFRKS